MNIRPHIRLKITQIPSFASQIRLFWLIFSLIRPYWAYLGPFGPIGPKAQWPKGPIGPIGLQAY